MSSIVPKRLSSVAIILVSLLLALMTHAAKESEAITISHRVIVNVGIYAPFSGESAYIGRNILASMEMGDAHLPASRIHYAFYTLDQLPKNQNTTAILQKFIDVQHINVLITAGRDNGLLAAALVSKNNIIHFNLANDSAIADGQHNFVVWNFEEESSLVRTKDVQNYEVQKKYALNMKPEFIKQFQQEYFNYPSVEAGYAYDVFNVVNRGIQMAGYDSLQEFPRQAIANHLHALAGGSGVMGSFKLDKQGVLYSRSEIASVTNVHKVLMG